MIKVRFDASRFACVGHAWSKLMAAKELWRFVQRHLARSEHAVDLKDAAFRPQ
jgi:hypothetical protein